MSSDFVVEISPDINNQYRLVVRAQDLPEAGTTLVPRQQVPLLPAELNLLRRGDATAGLSNKLANEMSAWLLGADLSAYLMAALGKNGKLRLVFSVDERLLPMLADVPVEMLMVGGGPLALRPQVDAIVHLLPKVGIAQASASMHSWPLRVLIVRSNPADLGGAVPPAAPIRDEIVNFAAQNLGAHLVEVDLLSREPGAVRPATWDVFRDQLRQSQYDILVYLGHGDLNETFEGLPPVGVLQFETPDGKSYVSVSSDQFKIELQNRPIPVVLLAGCLTAAEVPAAMRPLLDEDTPQWMRGSQGVAQALVNSESGVQFAVGMRYRLETAAAVRFLRMFFISLLRDEPGNVEAAVRAGREDLFALNPYPPSWSAPVIFRALGKEPTFDFLKSPPTTPPDPLDERDEEYRVTAWKGLVQQPLSTRTPESASSFMYNVLDKAEGQLRARAVARSALIWPDRVETLPGQTLTLPVQLFGTLDLSVLRGRLAVTGDDVNIVSLKPTQALKDSGYRLLYEYPEGNEDFFEIQRTSGAAVLPTGTLFEVTIKIGPASSIFYPVNVEIIETRPPRVVRAGNNALIIPPP